jgi:DNA-binding MarR family transcriptional regulator
MEDSPPFHFRKPEESSGYLLWQVSMRRAREMNRALEPLELTYTQFVVMAALMWVSRSQEHVTQSDIAADCKLDRMMVSKILRDFDTRGFVNRTPSQVDTRAKDVTPTPAGEALFSQAIGVVKIADEAFFGSLTDRPAFNAELRRLLEESFR